jgi:2-dehydropantoate 2-reductase
VSDTRYAIIGTGAVGGFYGARLARAGCEVHFLLRSDFEHVREHGLRVDSVAGDFRLARVHAHGRAEDLPACDVVVVALKATQNDRLAELLTAAAGEGGLVLMLQNGLGGEQAAAEVVGPDRVLGGLAFICAEKAGPGQVRHLDYGFLTLADYAADGRPRGITDRLRAVGADFEAAGVDVALAEDLVLARWKKLVWNVPFNGLSVVLDAGTDALLVDPDARALVVDLMDEVRAGAAACGREIEPAFRDHMLDLTERMTPYRTSMKLDADRGRPMEVEAIFGAPLRAARAGGTDLPHIATLYRQLRFLDARNSRKETPDSA